MQTVLVTGASSGIGAATALELERAGMTVFAGVRDPDDAAPLEVATSERLRLVRLDITDAGSIARAVTEIEAAVGGAGLDAVVNVAGIGVPGPLEVLEPAQLRTEFEVNVIGQVALTRALLPVLRRASGRVVFVGSIGGKVTVQFAGAYHASKYAMEAIADAWRQELAPDGIQVTLIEPGPIATPIWAKGASDLDDLLASGHPEIGRYAERLRSFQDSLRSAAKSATSPATVAGTIHGALTATRPRARYAVGGGAKIVSALRPLVPTRLLDAIGRRTAA